MVYFAKYADLCQIVLWLLCSSWRAQNRNLQFWQNAPALLKHTDSTLHPCPAPNILPSFGDGHRLVHQDVFHSLPGPARPEDFNCIRLGCISEADGDGQFGLREVGARGHDLPQEGMGADTHLDPSADGVAVAFGANEFQADPVVVQVLVIAQEQRRAANLCEHHIEVAIAVNIGKGRAAPDDGFE